MSNLFSAGKSLFVLRLPHPSVVIVALPFLLALAGCGDASPAAAVTSPELEKKPFQPPKPQGDETETTVSTEVLVGKTYERPRGAYIQDEKVPVGALRGVCRFTGAVSPPPPRAIDLAGSDAIRSAEKGELDYYQNLAMQEQPAVLSQSPGTPAVPSNVAIMLKGVKVGRLAPPVRAAFTALHGRLGRSQGDAYGFYGWSNVNFGPAGDRATLATGDLFPCHIELTHMARGKLVFEGACASYHDPKQPGKRWGTGDWMGGPKLSQTEPLHEPGVYRLSCRRHPWQKAYLLVVDNPYVTLSGATAGRSGAAEFGMNGVPVGTHTLEVWHQTCEPVKKTYEVEIRENETTEIVIEFKAPPELARLEGRK